MTRDRLLIWLRDTVIGLAIVAFIAWGIAA
jgi:hypothetical protein